jgi:hypothetical protein
MNLTAIFIANFVAAAGTVTAVLLGVGLVVLARKAHRWWKQSYD